MKDHGLDLAVIGNGRTAALVDPCSRLVWWCYPRFDGDPIFCRLLAGEEEKGFSDVVLDDMVEFHSEYVRNSAIVDTILTDRNGGKIRVTDFVPRFRQYERVFRPPQLFRIIEPIAGLPRITIRMRPTCEYGKPLRQRSLGSNHIRYYNDSSAFSCDTRKAFSSSRAYWQPAHGRIKVVSATISSCKRMLTRPSDSPFRTRFERRRRRDRFPGICGAAA